MIARLRGRVVSRRTSGNRDTAAVVVDVGGVGYLVLVPAGLTGRLTAGADEVELHTSLQVREDSMALYGFPTADGRDLFETLLRASGVGPKLALAALSTLSADALRRALADGDVDALTAVPGIGRKSAQRLVLELKDQLGPPAGDEVATTASVVAGGSPVAEVRLALLELGYSPGEAQRAVDPLDPDGDVGQLLRSALRALAAS
ncbi:MAG TPA: Holliday junction branch migration protein RuvA [Nitriliruptorales bacterium]|nr:Holliday junction branch migration protein RuvA [Nitriliruptorales bacterium]